MRSAPSARASLMLVIMRSALPSKSPTVAFICAIASLKVRMVGVRNQVSRLTSVDRIRSHPNLSLSRGEGLCC